MDHNTDFDIFTEENWMNEVNRWIGNTCVNHITMIDEIVCMCVCIWLSNTNSKLVTFGN